MRQRLDDPGVYAANRLAHRGGVAQRGARLLDPVGQVPIEFDVGVLVAQGLCHIVCGLSQFRLDTRDGLALVVRHS
ncbi:MAG: hypothetical protein IJK04_11085 [Kiritimatiellae bacterium]|nr:hypothetical protein [Kiritimatiellia bacterium]